MILPIRLYGVPVLRGHTKPVERTSKRLIMLIEDMIDTMHNAGGIGLAAPQVGRYERLFVVDVSPLVDSMPEQELGDLPEQPMVFINPDIIWESDEEEEYEEGCLSIPDILEDVIRPHAVRIAYRDRTFERMELQVDAILARVVQHEYDHLEGVLFLDHISAFRRQILKRRLAEIARGEVKAEYPTVVGVEA